MAIRKVKKEYTPSTSEIKILDTVSFLNEKKLYPLALGVYKILIGSSEPDIEIYKECPTYGTLLSLSSKHISRLVMMLIRYQYLVRIYDEKSDDLYLKLSTKGEMFLFNYHKKHKYSFKKKDPTKSVLIVKIEE